MWEDFHFLFFWSLGHSYWNSQLSFALVTTFYLNLFWRGVVHTTIYSTGVFNNSDFGLRGTKYVDYKIISRIRSWIRANGLHWIHRARKNYVIVLPFTDILQTSGYPYMLFSDKLQTILHNVQFIWLLWDSIAKKPRTLIFALFLYHLSKNFKGQVKNSRKYEGYFLQISLRIISHLICKMIAKIKEP